MAMVKHLLLLNAGWQRVRARGERDEGKRERRSGCVHVPWYSARPPSTSSLTLRDFFIKEIPSGKRKRHTLEEFILNAYLAGFGRASFPPPNLPLLHICMYYIRPAGRVAGHLRVVCSHWQSSLATQHMTRRIHGVRRRTRRDSRWHGRRSPLGGEGT